MKRESKGLTLNPEKCLFRMPQLITFKDYLLSIRGIVPTESRVEVVVQAF